jgi:short-subunit dehydrogenase
MSTTSRKIALVTGASSGIGAVYADRLARRGYDLVLVARRADRLHALARSLASTHAVRAQALVADLGTDEGQAAVEQFLSVTPVDMLVNNAGIARLAPLSGAPLQDALAQITLNITALTRLAHAVLPGMKARNAGTIVNVASVLALTSLSFSAVYSGTKAFVLAFSEGLQQELAGSGVTVQVVLPASTATEIWEQSGVPLSALAPEAVMLTEHMVDAALVGLDRGESKTMPSVHDSALLAQFDAARAALFGAAQTGKVAPRLLAATAE